MEPESPRRMQKMTQKGTIYAPPGAQTAIILFISYFRISETISNISQKNAEKKSVSDKEPLFNYAMMFVMKISFRQKIPPCSARCVTGLCIF